MSDTVILDGELSLTNMLDGEAGTVIEVGHGTGIDTIVFNSDYTLTFNMSNGETFTTGNIRGEHGAQGQKGEQGDDYVLTQADMEHIASLVPAPEVPVEDVQINGTRIVQDGVANVPVASNKVLGVVRTDSEFGTGIYEGRIFCAIATEAQIKAGRQFYRPICPDRQHQATFYGLAKAAGDATQSASTNAVGQYTEDAKTAIRTMLGLDTESLVAEIRDALGI